MFTHPVLFKMELHSPLMLLLLPTHPGLTPSAMAKTEKSWHLTGAEHKHTFLHRYLHHIIPSEQ
jgi:hypothetical protein